MRKKVAAGEKPQRPVSKDDVAAELQAFLVRVAQHRVIGERIVKHVRLARYREECQADQESRQKHSGGALRTTRPTTSTRVGRVVLNAPLSCEIIVLLV